jgi:hypothetical protein
VDLIVWRAASELPWLRHRAGPGHGDRAIGACCCVDWHGSAQPNLPLGRDTARRPRAERRPTTVLGFSIFEINFRFKISRKSL